MSGFDLDAARAARVEKLDERYFTFGGERFELPAEIPFEAIESNLGALAAGDLTGLTGFMKTLLGDEAHARFASHTPSVADVNELVGWLMKDYGLNVTGQNGASGESIDPKLPPS